MNETQDPGEKGQSLTELKHVRRLVKLNKIDDPNAEQEHGGFIQKISKKLELMVTSSNLKEEDKVRKSESKKSESLRKALLQSRNTSNKVQDNDKMVNEEPIFYSPSSNTAITEVNSASKTDDCISAEFFKILTTETVETIENYNETDCNVVNIDKEPETKQKSPPPSIFITAAKNNEPKPFFPAGNEPKLRAFDNSHAKSGSSRNTLSDKDKNKRRQSFSINSINSKSKAYYVYSSSVKNDQSTSPGKRRLTTCQKPVTPSQPRRKSVNPREGLPELASVPKPVGKSVTPEKYETFSLVKAENKQLKKDLLRKAKEVENLKREKLALLKKLKMVDLEEISENKENSLNLVEMPKVYCRIRPHQATENTRSALTFPEVKLMREQNKENQAEPFTIKCVEMNNENGKKATFYFDRVFAPECTQTEVPRKSYLISYAL